MRRENKLYLPPPEPLRTVRGANGHRHGRGGRERSAARVDFSLGGDEIGNFEKLAKPRRERRDVG